MRIENGGVHVTWQDIEKSLESDLTVPLSINNQARMAEYIKEHELDFVEALNKFFIQTYANGEAWMTGLPIGSTDKPQNKDKKKR